MSVLIKGMKMPRDCIECRFFELSDEYCYARGAYGSEWGKSTGCPLVELPDPKVFAARMELTKCYFPKDAIVETLRDRLDPEMSHIKADRLMCELLTELGYGEAVKIFEEMEKWYS